MRFLIVYIAFSCYLFNPLFSQKISNEEIKRRIESYKTDSRGPYKEIRWYCKDGTIIPPQEKCPEPGGVQRARHKEEVYALSLSNHVFLGQILSTTPFPDFWDTENYNSRLKQFQLEKYLKAIDNGWILRKAQYYRGAFQAEDEEEWGMGFYNWLLADDQVIKKYFFLIRQSLKDIPHMGDNNLTQNIRASSKVISDRYPAFLTMRIKIHGQPDISDIKKVELFRDNNKQQLEEDILRSFDELIRDMKTLYKPIDMNSLNRYINQMPKDSDLKESISLFISEYSRSQSGKERIAGLSRMIYELREEILSVKNTKGRLAIFDLSIAFEDILSREQSGLQMNSIKDHLENIQYLGLAAAGCGYIEIWEWDHLSPRLIIPAGPEAALKELVDFFEAGRSLTEWGSGIFRAQYADVNDLFGGFEKSANGFLDDKVRSSILLHYGSSVDKLGDYLSAYLSVSNRVMDIQGQNAARGLNPGFAKGELVVLSGQAENITVDKEKIYIFNNPPPDLKPVAGIATVNEGNMVSHVQLLARNLGIPNSVISSQNLEELKFFSGQIVFYAVSSGGTVVLKPENQMSLEEKKLFEIRKRNQEKISVPVGKIDLSQTMVIDLRQVSAKSSGIICGPKAANLGQLKLMFPDHVVEGIVIPFGIFRKHLDQMMPGQNMSYWQYLNNLFEKSNQMRENGVSDEETEAYILTELGNFRKYISQIKLQNSFITDLETSFRNVFGRDIGNLPVFLRSDTNMEDLKDFTGAGLNLTLFNVVAYEAILQGIKDVWASPYTERSYKWRQQYLLNPENVFPSILIIPSVDVDCSGVMVTTGISSQDENDITIAFSRGAGGAVDGQAAESYLLKRSGRNILLTPAREPSYKRLPMNGGTSNYFTTFENPVLNENNINSLRHFAEQIKKQLPFTPGIETAGPFDIELGFKENKLWLFQVRPFVENKNAGASAYLNSLNPEFRKNKMISINE